MAYFSANDNETPHIPHRFYSADVIADLLHAHPYGGGWRAACPAHAGDNPTSLSIRAGTDQYGNPCTLLHCFAQQCDVKDICEALGIQVPNLFAIQPQYARETRRAPRAHSPRIDRLRGMPEPTPDDIALILLEEMIISDPEFIQSCEPARRKLWELAQASVQAHDRLTRMLRQAGISPTLFWHALAAESNQEGRPSWS